VRVSIADTGIGISPKDRKRILEGFVRLPEGKVMAKGVGLGLKTVHELLELHGSELEVTGQLGKGSVFSFTLPLVRP
ncbi:MAG TPA: ATP-binding protein, partial [Elusimicrobiota bacterium]|nr:ATP-binding protein [Elusimicrobiota bacterium]